MKIKSIFILVILFAGLVLISFYGTKLREGLTDSEGLTNSGNTADNQFDYDDKKEELENASIQNNGSDIIQSGSSLYGPNGEICQVLVDEKNKQSLEVRDTINAPPVYYNFSKPNTFTGPNGATAEVYRGVDTQPRIKVTDNKGNAKVFAIDGSNSNSNDTHVSSPNYNSAVDTGFMGTHMGSNNYNSAYSSSLVTGIPASQIVPGTEDLYILKSQVVPQVCPACNNNSSNQSSSKKEMCPPCPACARCPEPSFECKKVPNYKSIDSQNLPFPILNDFTSFGM
jgi:hypothetical protein